MSEENKKTTVKTDLKKLRLERAAAITRARDAIKSQNKMIKDLKKALSEGAKTVPEIAQAMKLETDKILVYISTLKRYGIISEGAKAGNYFKYELTS